MARKRRDRTRRSAMFRPVALFRLACALWCVTGISSVSAADTPGASQTAPAATKPKPCATPAHRQFDFWLGDWEVHNPAGKRVGHNRISAVHDGCALQEQWQGDGGFSGTS